ncbi:ubiquitin-conjugating enzyme/RWD-like protein, partial [Pelagophyceae sp. CCMP2097]
MYELSLAHEALAHDSADVRVLAGEELTPWRVVLRGPRDTPWEGGTFQLAIDFGPEYPLEPPTVHFLTPILHPNVDDASGRACHSILGTAYTSETMALDVILAIKSMLYAPEPSDALNQQVAMRMRDDSAFRAEVQR